MKASAQQTDSRGCPIFFEGCTNAKEIVHDESVNPNESLNVYGLESGGLKILDYDDARTTSAFRQLVDDEKARRELLKMAGLSKARMSISIKHTVLTVLFRDPLFLVTMAVYFVCRFIIVRMEWGPNNNVVYNLTPLSIVASLISFLIVFFLQQSYVRFDAQYRASMAIIDSIFDLLLVTREILPISYQWKLWRLVNAAHLLAYVGLSDHYNEDNFFEPMNERFQFLSPAEVLKLKKIGIDDTSVAYREVLTWANDTIYYYFSAGIKKYPGRACSPPELVFMSSPILKLKASMKTLFDYNDQPVPFQYIHFVYAMQSVYLLILAFALANSIPYKKGSASSLELVCPVCLFLVCLFVIGLTALARKFQDPYGEDVEDMCVMYYIEQAAILSAKITLADTSYQQTMDEANEAAVEKHMKAFLKVEHLLTDLTMPNTHN